MRLGLGRRGSRAQKKKKKRGKRSGEEWAREGGAGAKARWAADWPQFMGPMFFIFFLPMLVTPI